MTTYQNASELTKLTLGKTTQYIDKYDASLLQAVPRSLNRDSLSIDPLNLPFNGEDVWYGYELSWLNGKGKPVVAVAEFRFPCTSNNIVESKSFKLYLNSFNQTRFESWDIVLETLTKDLSKLVEESAQVNLYPVDNCPPLALTNKTAKCIDEQDITIDNYDFSANYLASANDELTAKKVTKNLVSHLLKSNCLITNQPDWASIYISYTGQAISEEALLRYLISFRQHNEFHEQCIERIFCDIQQFCNIEELTVFARYTRRGGLDINPFRTTSLQKAPALRTLRQ